MRPLGAGGLDDEHAGFELDRRRSMKSGTHSRFPGELNLPRRQGSRAQQVGERRGHRRRQRVHRAVARSYHRAVRLVLASASPRRAELLRAAGFSFDTLVVHVDESPRADETPIAYVQRLAREKSARALETLPAPAPMADRRVPAARDRGAVVLAADTAVVLDGRILSKPRDDDEAASMLRLMSGRTHEVLTGISLRRHDLELSHVEVTAVLFAALAADEIAWYIATGEGRDKAGGYGIQGLASRFVVRIEGSYSNVVGLPVAAVYRLMKGME